MARVASVAYPDATQFQPNSKYYEPKATLMQPRWFNVDVQLLRKTRLMKIAEMRSYPELFNMRTLQRGNRLSITPVDPAEWQFILQKLDE